MHAEIVEATSIQSELRPLSKEKIKENSKQQQSRLRGFWKSMYSSSSRNERKESLAKY